MKTKMILIILSVTLLVTGCSSTKPVSDIVQAATPEDAIGSMFTALKTVDAPTFNSLVQYKRTKENGVIVETERFFGNVVDDENKTYLAAVFEKLTYTIISSSDQTDEQITITLEITNKDLSEINASDYSNSDNPIMAQVDAIKEVTETITKTIDVDVVKSGAGWLVVIDDELRSALWGNKQGILDALSNWFLK